MTIRLTLFTPPSGPPPHQARIGDDVALDDAGRQQAHLAGSHLLPVASHLTAPSTRCRDTAAALGLIPLIDGELRAWDLGSWNGSTLHQLAARDPAAVTAWTTDPTATPHGGESLDQLCRRTAAWMDALPPNSGRVLAITDQSVARAAVVHALTAPTLAFWRIDIPPLAHASLTGRAGRWNLRLE